MVVIKESTHGELRFSPGNSLLEVLHANPHQTEGGLGFLDLLIDGAHITREIAGVQRQRDHQFALGSSMRFQLLFLCNFGVVGI